MTYHSISAYTGLGYFDFDILAPVVLATDIPAYDNLAPETFWHQTIRHPGHLGTR